MCFLNWTTPFEVVGLGTVKAPKCCATFGKGVNKNTRCSYTRIGERVGMKFGGLHFNLCLHREFYISEDVTHPQESLSEFNRWGLDP